MKQMQSYALVLQNHDFLYEVQAIAKIFIANTRFQICENGILPDNIENYIITAINLPCISVDVCLHDKSVHKEIMLSQKITEEDLEFQLCKLLYDVLQELTGYIPPWGMLTGIRPVRKVLQALENGCTPEQACQNLQKKYLISDEKIKLALTVALVQKPILPHDNKKIGLYISVPFCPTRCSYCSFVSHSIKSAKALIPDYIEKLCEEIQILGNMIQKFNLSVDSIYIGGGTPTAVSASQLQHIMQAIANDIDISHIREYTVEAGRADTITEEKLHVMKSMQADRISVNPQTMQDTVLQAIGRRHTVQQVIDAFSLARKIGFDNINMDLIAGLPSDTYTGFLESLKKTMELQPDSITVHTLTLKRSADLYGSDTHAKIDDIIRMVQLSAKILPENGYRPYYLYRQKNTLGNLENVGYAKKGKENLYNILIMNETQTILGAGCGASTKLVQADGNITRILNYKFPYEYINRFDMLMQKKQQIAEILQTIDSR